MFHDYRHVEERALERENTLSEANSRLTKLDVLETEIVARAEELKASREESQALKDAVSISASHLEKLEALEIDTAALREELRRCQQEKEEIENSLAEEKSRTLHLVGGWIYDWAFGEWVRGRSYRGDSSCLQILFDNETNHPPRAFTILPSKSTAFILRRKIF